MENMDNELDLVTFEDDDGNEMTMEVVDYLFYEGKEYALLTELVENEAACESCDAEDCNGCASQREAFIMEVHPVGDDQLLRVQQS